MTGLKRKRAASAAVLAMPWSVFGDHPQHHLIVYGDETIKPWNNGTMEQWNNGTMEQWDNKAKESVESMESMESLESLIGELN